MAITVPPVSQVVADWKAGAAGATTKYATNTAAASNAYQSGVAGANANYVQAVTEAASAGRWQRGTENKGGFYATRASTIGAQRWSPGINASEQQYQAAMQRNLSIIGGLTLPPALPRGNPGNLQRVSIIDEALHAARLAS